VAQPARTVTIKKAALISGAVFAALLVLTPALAAPPVTHPSQISYTANGGTSRTLAAKLGELCSVKDFGAIGDGATDNAPAFRLAITACAGGTLRFPSGVFNFGSTIVLANSTIYYGASADQIGSSGTRLVFTGTGDALQINNPINSFTAADIVIRDLSIISSPGAGGVGNGVIADTGSSFLTILNVNIQFQTSGMVGVLMDQTEQAIIEKSNIITATAGTAGHPSMCVWLVNGTEHNGAASSGFTNRITIRDSQIGSPAATANIIGVADDGGASHVFRDNNFNGGDSQLRIASANDVTVSGTEFEVSLTSAIYAASTRVLGSAAAFPTGSLNVSSSFLFRSGTYMIKMDTAPAQALWNLTMTGLVFILEVGVSKPVAPFSSAVAYVNATGNIGRQLGTVNFVTDGSYAGLGFATSDFVPFNGIVILGSGAAAGATFGAIQATGGAAGYAISATGNATRGPLRLSPLAAAPTTPLEGDVYEDSTKHMLLYYDGAAWNSTSNTTATGTARGYSHTVSDTGTLAAGTLTVAFSGRAAFVLAATVFCTANDTTAANTIWITYASGTSVTFNGTGTDTFKYICVGT